MRDEAGSRVDEAWRVKRRDKLLALFDVLAPDLLVIESFPFGRRQLSAELMPLLEAAHARNPRPAIICSIRDILQAARKPGRVEETVARLRAYFDCVAVHGDPRFAALEESFPEAREIDDLVHYTGFVAAPRAALTARADTAQGEVVVSMGAGAIGPALPDAALAARPLSKLADAPWRLITGPHLPEREFARLQEAAPSDVVVERFRADFRALLAAAELSISYAGYNTATDLMQAGVPAVVITYGGEKGGETEQRERAARLATHGLAAVLSDHDLSPEALAGAIDTALALPSSEKHSFALDGARKTAELLLHRSVREAQR